MVDNYSPRAPELRTEACGAFRWAWVILSGGAFQWVRSFGTHLHSGVSLLYVTSKLVTH